jgi:hypothetical protein
MRALYLNESGKQSGKQQSGKKHKQSGGWGGPPTLPV